LIGSFGRQAAQQVRINPAPGCGLGRVGAAIQRTAADFAARMCGLADIHYPDAAQIRVVLPADCQIPTLAPSRSPSWMKRKPRVGS